MTKEIMNYQGLDECYNYEGHNQVASESLPHHIVGEDNNNNGVKNFWSNLNTFSRT
jgi:hypothetical protein